MKIEFFTDRQTGQAMYRKDGGSIVELKQGDTEMIGFLLDKSYANHRKQYEALEEKYEKYKKNKINYDFRRARCIINCCYGEQDCKADVDSDGSTNHEIVKCPMIAECEYYKVICQPEYTTGLSKGEERIMRLVKKGKEAKEIASELFLSLHTVNNHRRNALNKLGLGSISEFINYANERRLFQ